MNIGKQNFKTVIINIFGNLSKKELPSSTLAPTFGKNVEDVAMIGINVYHLACQLKRAQVFTFSMRNLKFQAKKEARSETNSKIVLLEKYYDLLDVFSKKNLDTLSLYQKYDYKILLEEE